MPWKCCPPLDKSWQILCITMLFDDHPSLDKCLLPLYRCAQSQLKHLPQVGQSNEIHSTWGIGQVLWHHSLGSYLGSLFFKICFLTQNILGATKKSEVLGCRQPCMCVKMALSVLFCGNYQCAQPDCCSQFHLHFTSSFCADILMPKNSKP